jgi:hypothetical protein
VEEEIKKEKERQIQEMERSSKKRKGREKKIGR